MRSLYWKIFISLWITTVLISLTTVWVINTLAQQSYTYKSQALVQVYIADDENILISFKAKLILCVILAVFISGIVCYLLSLYLTRPLSVLCHAAKAIGRGRLQTRVGTLPGHHNDEIAHLSEAFDGMAVQIEYLLAAKERLLQDISHELRSPLARLQIAIALGQKKTFALAEEEFNKMELETQRLNGLIGEILDFARLNQPEQQLYLEKLDLASLIQDIVKDANYEFNKKSIRINAELAIIPSLWADKHLMYRCIENVIRNAALYSPNNKEVLVRLTLDEMKQEVCIIVEDKGAGVPTEELQAIFRPFYKVDSSRNSKSGGFGLGLALAARAVALHGGTISAKNRANKGLVVSISIPLKAHPKD